MRTTGDDTAKGEIQSDIVVLAGPCKLIHLNVESELPENSRARSMRPILPSLPNVLLNAPGHHSPSVLVSFLRVSK
jgi:hypothetical protein